MKYELKDWLNSINFTKENLIEDDPEMISSYPSYIINRCLSGHLDTVLFGYAVFFLAIYFEEEKKIFPLVEEGTSR